MNDPLASAIAGVQDRIRLTPDAAHARFASNSRLTQGFRSEVDIRQHHLTVDEPPALGGSDAGPNPVELVLAALGACQEITYRAYATALGIPLDAVAVNLEGDLDLRGFLGLNDAVRPGYGAIRGTVQLRSSASPEQLAQLKAAVDAHCPVLDMLSRPVPIALELQRL